MKYYDYIIAGSGCAGLSIAYYLAHSRLGACRVLLIDRLKKSENDRTWCFWTTQPTEFDTIINHSWHHLIFADKQGELSQALPNLSYQLLKGLDFYQFTQDAIAQHSNFEHLTGEIASIGEDAAGAYVVVGEEKYGAKWVFNSCLDWRAWQAQNQHQLFLLQHFKGYIIETESPQFRAQQATLMDFRTAQPGDTRFFYVLPFTEHKALVEYTIFSENLLQASEYHTELLNYLHQQLGIEQYTILDEEFGVIPMTDASHPHSKGSHIIPVGILGGAIKPSTGYAFLKIQQQAQQLVRQLEQGQIPDARLPRKWRFRFYDRLLLHIINKEGHLVNIIFSSLFRNNPIERILCFLDERTTIWQELLIFARLPIRPFLRALYQLYLPSIKNRTHQPEFSPLLKTIK